MQSKRGIFMFVETRTKDNIMLQTLKHAKQRRGHKMHKLVQLNKTAIKNKHAGT